MTSPGVFPDDPAFDLGNEDDSSLPPLLRRPDPTADPVPVTQLRGARKALLSNPFSALDEEAASVVTGGAADPVILGALVGITGPGTDGINLLTPKPVVGGTLHVIAPHRRYLDLDVLPDFINQRWAHLLRAAMDARPPATPMPTYETLRVTAEGEERPLAIFKVRMKDRAALAEAVTQSMRQTYYAQKGENDYTDSVLQQGVKEPLTMFIVRVVYGDRTSETYLVSGDGNSRLVSMWLARTGSDIDAAAAACVATVIGPVDRAGPMRPADQRAARRRVELMTTRVRRGLAERVLTESTRREGHTVTFPAVVVVGAQAEDGAPLPDLVAARDDLLANLHVHVTPWADGAQYAQGMHRVYRHAASEGLITAEEHRVLSGTVGPDRMHALLGLPPHRLWSAALHQHAVLANGSAWEMNKLICQEFGMGKADRKRVGDRLGTVALSGYRSLDGVEQALRTFGDGGTITDDVWKQPWDLTGGTDPLTVLDEVLERALAGYPDAVAELTVLGGTAAILDGLITRDRGSKLGATRSDGKAPFRAAPTRLLTILSGTDGGRRMLHSIARAHVAADPAVLPKAFYTATREVSGEQVHDGDPVTDKAGAQVTLDYEWDLVYTADPVEAERVIALTKAANGKTGGGGTDDTPEDVRPRRRLDLGLTEAVKAARTLARMVQSRGRQVFGAPDAVETLRQRLKAIDEILLTFGPMRTDVLVLDDEDGEE